MTVFILNNQLIRSDQSSGGTVLDFVRYEKGLVGTKIGCREGDCGACTVLVGSLENGKLTYQSMTSCLTPLENVHHKHVLTVEGINQEKLTPVQQFMLQQNGTQCGFCTPGFIMSMTGFTISDETPSPEHAIKAIDGNICRCTGYKSIERAAEALCASLKNRPEEDKISWLADQGHLPEYVKDIESRLIELKNKDNSDAPTKEEQVDYFLGGGTDLLVQKPEVIKTSRLRNKFDDPTLKGIEVDQDSCKIGASVTVSDLENAAAFKNIFPDLATYLKLVSSSPIRNMATLAGNFVNASPIGDMTIFFLALDASIVLDNQKETRTIALKDFFLDYKKMDKAADEYIAQIHFALPSKADHFNFEKVSKRTHLDIASVNSACKMNIDENGIINKAHLSAGGVAAIPKYLFEASAFLKGKKMEAQIVKQFIEIVNEEVTPISDARGSADYKRLLLRQLVLAHLIKFFGPIKPITKLLGQ